MGAKFYRGADKPKKMRKRFSQTRSWFRTLKWVAYHAHPTMIAGHPFKGGWVQSVGQLQHPDLKRFQIATPILFTPVFPGKNPYDHFTKPTIPSFNDFFSSYFGAKNLSVSNERCQKLVDGLKRCYTNHQNNEPVENCQFYINGTQRACSV
eukprot:403338333